MRDVQQFIERHVGFHVSYSGPHRNLDTQLTEDGEICKSESLTQQYMRRRLYDFSLCLFPLINCRRTSASLWLPQLDERTTKEDTLGVAAESIEMTTVKYGF